MRKRMKLLDPALGDVGRLDEAKLIVLIDHAHRDGSAGISVG
jgi:pyrimidine operon attenuation protein/uracil phosphoribosyltransferase